MKKLKGKIDKKHLIFILSLFLIICSIIIGTSYGLFTKKDGITDINFVTGTLNYKLENSDLKNNSIELDALSEHKLTINLISLNNFDTKYELFYLVNDKKELIKNIEVGYSNDSVDSVTGTIKSKGTKKITLRIKNKTDKKIKVTLGCEGGLINNNLVMSMGNNLNKLITDDIMLAYTYEGSEKAPTKFPAKSDGYSIKEMTCTGATVEWDNETWGLRILNTTSKEISCDAVIVDGYKDKSGINPPKIFKGMIPVRYDSSKNNWIKADISQKWYDYSTKEWANVVTVDEKQRSTYEKMPTGSVIEMQDINSMWVWIPRYEYETITSTNSAPINIKFISGINNPKTPKFITHPAFTFGGKQLEGIWVAKFEAGNVQECQPSEGSVDSGCDLTNINIQIKPNVNSWRGIRASTAFLNSLSMNAANNIYGFLDTEVDTHMMKNLEWGAVAYLTNSIYGRCKDNVCEEVTINNNYSHITGLAGETPSETQSVSDKNKYNTVKGQLASTTGNIYGIYDMSGGAHEYVMGIMNDNTNTNPMSGGLTSSNSGFKGIVSDSGKNTLFDSTRTFPDKKYYDSYKYGTTFNDKEAFNRFKKGDATKETKGWNQDYAYFIFSDQPWFKRGGNYESYTTAGMFYFSSGTGAASYRDGFRPTLVQK